MTLRYMVVEDVQNTFFERPARFYTETFTDKNPVVSLQFQHGWGRFKWWRTYFTTEVVYPETPRLAKARLLKNAVQVM